MSLLHSDVPLSVAYDVALTDLDGCAWAGAQAIAHAPEGIAEAKAAGMRVVYVTNNASRPPSDVAAQLTGLGLATDPEDVYTSAMAGADLALGRHGAGAKILIVGGEGLVDAVSNAGMVPVRSAEDGPVAVIQGFHPSVGWEQLSEASYAIHAGADFIATNLDSTLVRERGLAVGNGSLVMAVQHATGVVPVSAGKPEPQIFRLSADKAGAISPLAVGDRLDTDIAGGVAAGFPSLHVLTGVSSARDVMVAAPAFRPSFLGLDLRDLNLPHLAAVRDGEWWVCGSARARVDGATVQAEVGGVVVALDAPVRLTKDAYRAATAAAWAAQDAGKELVISEVTVVDA